MNLNTEVKQKVIAAMLHNRSNFSGSDTRFANSLGIHKSAYSQIKKGVTEKVLSEANWISLARKFNVQIGKTPDWIIANTPVYVYITKQLEYCQTESTTGLFCDKADLGKTFTAKHFCSTHKNAVYVDCSLVKSKQKLVRYIARMFGVDYNGKYSDVFEDLVYYLKLIPTPLIVLDEAGDLDYAAFLELKALWNATEGFCGWYMMGADGLEKKIQSGIDNKKVGYTEIFRRYGSKYQCLSPKGKDEYDLFMFKQASAIIKSNMPGLKDKEIEHLIIKSNKSLTRVEKEVKKLKRQSQLN